VEEAARRNYLKKTNTKIIIEKMPERMGDSVCESSLNRQEKTQAAKMALN
jgi:hypothetical protein